VAYVIVIFMWLSNCYKPWTDGYSEYSGVWSSDVVHCNTSNWQVSRIKHFQNLSTWYNRV